MSAFYDQASLVVVPSGYKSGKIYAQKPLTTDGQLTFTRASTATRVNASGLIEEVASGVPRLDYTNSSCPKLLLEPQRTNLVTFSEQFDNAGWAKSGASVTANAVLGPDGYTSADKLVEDASNSEHIVTQTNLFTATGAFYTASIFVKAAERTYVAFSTRGTFTANSNTLIFNLTTGEWELDDSTQNFALNAEAFPNGWYRISLNTDTTSGAFDSFGVGTAIGSSSWLDAVYTGDGTSGIYIWGAQLEEGAYETSLIPTLSTSVTRVADLASKTGISSLIGQTEGTLFLEMRYEVPQQARIAISDGTGANWIFFSFPESVSETRVRIAASNVVAFDLSSVGVFNAGQDYKIALAYKSGNWALYINGASVFSGTQTFTFNGTLDRLILTGTVSATNPVQIYGKANQALLFKTRLTNAQLAELTTL